MLHRPGVCRPAQIDTDPELVQRGPRDRRGGRGSHRALRGSVRSRVPAQRDLASRWLPRRSAGGPGGSDRSCARAAMPRERSRRPAEGSLPRYLRGRSGERVGEIVVEADRLGRRRSRTPHRRLEQRGRLHGPTTFDEHRTEMSNRFGLRRVDVQHRAHGTLCAIEVSGLSCRDTGLDEMTDRRPGCPAGPTCVLRTRRRRIIHFDASRCRRTLRKVRRRCGWEGSGELPQSSCPARFRSRQSGRLGSPPGAVSSRRAGRRGAGSRRWNEGADTRRRAGAAVARNRQRLPFHRLRHRRHRAPPSPRDYATDGTALAQRTPAEPSARLYRARVLQRANGSSSSARRRSGNPLRPTPWRSPKPRTARLVSG